MSQTTTIYQLRPPKPEESFSNSSREIAENVPEKEKERHTTVDVVSKYKPFITSDRLAQLRRAVEDAIKEHKIFTIRGGWHTLRKAFLRRNWVEKYDVTSKPRVGVNTPSNLEELCVNLPTKQSWETQSAHIMKCERTIMSRLLQLHEVDFYWNTRRDNHDMHLRMSCNKLISRFSRSLFTSKEGLCLLLQQMYWHNEPGVANVNFPRCYVLGFPDHFNNFVDDFRITACISLLKYIVHTFETQDQYAIQSPEGQVPYSAYQFALDRLNEFLASKKHMDIDVEIPVVDQNEWTVFLENFRMVVHENKFFLENKSYILPVIVASSKVLLKKLSPYWPQMNLDGMKNIWIMKPGNKCRGRGIQLIKDVKDVARVMELKLKYVVQKYIEKPLIIYNTKFDIRQWFLITSVQPLVIWMYRESYLRFSSQNFSLDNFHESLHLTNHAVQCKYKNTQNRDKALPEDNMWDSYMFQSYLSNNNNGTKWENVIYPGMKESIIGAMLSCQDTMDRRPNTFELYGADFILAEDFKPWLLEINSSPDLSSSTSVTARMCPQCLEDLVKVVIDKKRDPSADTGNFVLIYKQNFPRPPAYLGMNLTVRGRRIFKRHKSIRDKENDGSRRLLTSPVKKCSRLSAPERINPILEPIHDYEKGAVYHGPVIADLIEEIHQQNTDSETNEGVETAVPIRPSGPKKRTKMPDKVAQAASTVRCTPIQRKSPSSLTRGTSRKPAKRRNVKTAPQPLQQPPSSVAPAAVAAASPSHPPTMAAQAPCVPIPKRISGLSEWRNLERGAQISCATDTGAVTTTHESVVSMLRAKRTNNAKFNKGLPVTEKSRTAACVNQLDFEQMRREHARSIAKRLEELQLQQELKLKQFASSLEESKLLTVGRSISKLVMRPRT